MKKKRPYKKPTLTVVPPVAEPAPTGSSRSKNEAPPDAPFSPATGPGSRIDLARGPDATVVITDEEPLPTGGLDGIPDDEIPF